MQDFIVVFFSTDSASENRPDYSFIRDMYNILHPKYRRNLKALYIVHSNWWVRLSIMIMNAFFTSDIREKVPFLVLGGRARADFFVFCFADPHG